jgi:site-specific recombinase XerD
VIKKSPISFIGTAIFIIGTANLQPEGSRMNANTLSLSQIIEGFNLAARARALSEHTIQDYNTTYKKFKIHLGSDLIFSSVTKKHIRQFLAAQTHLSNKTLLNYHTGLSALYTWAVNEGYADEQLMHGIDRPKPEQRVIQPIPVDHIRAMLSCLGQSKAYARPGKRTSTHATPCADRNRAILLLLLDTGLRASELCGILIHQIDLDQRKVKVFGKGSKERILPFSARTGQVIWKYLAAQRKDDHLGQALFATQRGQPLTRTHLRHIIERICARADLPKYTPHDFRHTFAVNYLRNYPNIYTLQEMLGHTTLDMVKRYLAISQNDLDEAHRHASPVEKWGL